MITKKEGIFLEKIVRKFENQKKSEKYSYPLLEKGFTAEDIIKGIEILLSRKLTMGKFTKIFEKEFCKFIGANYALMVNSGSSANLLAAFALINPKKKNHLKPGDEFIIPAICWSTSLWPLVQAGLKPNFIDVDKSNYCIDTKKLSEKKFRNIKAIMNIHILGNSPDMNNLMNFVKRKKTFLIEDTCEALGSIYGKKHLGTFGDFGTFSFYYSHQITSGEGGMIVCKTKEDYELLHTLRAHGWDRGLSRSKNKFNFINSGFNVRPLDLTAVIGLSQLKRLKDMIKKRTLNRNLLINKLKNSDKWDNQFKFFDPTKNLKPSWFGFPILINKPYLKNKKKFMNFLNSSGIETRPILSGNFLNQPSSKLYGFNIFRKKFKISQEIEDGGLFIGLPTKNISKGTINFLTSKLLSIKK